MCGRIAQYKGVAAYLATLDSDVPVVSGYDDVPLARYNVAPSSRVQVIREVVNGTVVAAVKWGWQPFWAVGRMPPPINARVETVASGKYFKTIWPNRALVSADGWYEWVHDPANPKRKQPWFIRLRSGEPMFMAAIGQFSHDGGEAGQSDGFVILTADAKGGLLDIHDRRPIVLTPSMAREWVAVDTTPERAEDIALNHALPAEAFEWYPVERAIGNVRNEGPQLILPLDRGPGI